MPTPFYRLLFSWRLRFCGRDSVLRNLLFNQPSLQWIGLLSYKPITEEYVPLRRLTGRHSLILYLIRQSILLALLYPVTLLQKIRLRP
jgi:uncharacterized membrane protein